MSFAVFEEIRDALLAQDYVRLGALISTDDGWRVLNANTDGVVRLLVEHLSEARLHRLAVHKLDRVQATGDAFHRHLVHELARAAADDTPPSRWNPSSRRILANVFFRRFTSVVRTWFNYIMDRWDSPDGQPRGRVFCEAIKALRAHEGFTGETLATALKLDTSVHHHLLVRDLGGVLGDLLDRRVLGDAPIFEDAPALAAACWFQGATQCLAALLQAVASVSPPMADGLRAHVLDQHVDRDLLLAILGVPDLDRLEALARHLLRPLGRVLTLDKDASEHVYARCAGALSTPQRLRLLQWLGRYEAEELDEASGRLVPIPPAIQLVPPSEDALARAALEVPDDDPRFLLALWALLPPAERQTRAIATPVLARILTMAARANRPETVKAILFAPDLAAVWPRVVLDDVRGFLVLPIRGHRAAGNGGLLLPARSPDNLLELAEVTRLLLAACVRDTPEAGDQVAVLLSHFLDGYLRLYPDATEPLEHWLRVFGTLLPYDRLDETVWAHFGRDLDEAASGKHKPTPRARKAQALLDANLQQYATVLATMFADLAAWLEAMRTMDRRYKTYRDLLGQWRDSTEWGSMRGWRENQLQLSCHVSLPRFYRGTDQRPRETRRPQLEWVQDPRVPLRMTNPMVAQGEAAYVDLENADQPEWQGVLVVGLVHLDARLRGLGLGHRFLGLLEQYVSRANNYVRHVLLEFVHMDMFHVVDTRFGWSPVFDLPEGVPADPRRIYPLELGTDPLPHVGPWHLSFTSPMEVAMQGYATDLFLFAALSNVLMPQVQHLAAFLEAVPHVKREPNESMTLVLHDGRTPMVTLRLVPMPEHVQRREGPPPPPMPDDGPADGAQPMTDPADAMGMARDEHNSGAVMEHLRRLGNVDAGTPLEVHIHPPSVPMEVHLARLTGPEQHALFLQHKIMADLLVALGRVWVRPLVIDPRAFPTLLAKALSTHRPGLTWRHHGSSSSGGAMRWIPQPRPATANPRTHVPLPHAPPPGVDPAEPEGPVSLLNPPAVTL